MRGAKWEKRKKPWIHLTIKLYLSHFPRLDRPKTPHFAASKWFQKSFYYYHCSISCISALELAARSRKLNCQKCCEETVFFMACLANIFRPRRFEDTSQLLTANMIWTSESSEYFFFLSQSELNYELRKQKNRIIFQKSFSVQDAVSVGSRFLVCYFSTLHLKCTIYKTNCDAYYQEWPMLLVNSLLVKFQSLLEWVFSLTRKCICLMIIIEQLCSMQNILHYHLIYLAL